MAWVNTPDAFDAVSPSHESDNLFLMASRLPTIPSMESISDSRHCFATSI